MQQPSRPWESGPLQWVTITEVVNASKVKTLKVYIYIFDFCLVKTCVFWSMNGF